MELEQIEALVKEVLHKLQEKFPEAKMVGDTLQVLNEPVSLLFTKEQVVWPPESISNPPSWRITVIGPVNSKVIGAYNSVTQIADTVLRMSTK
jgi:hypothetical protein